MNKTPVSVAVTGAAGAIGYSILFRIASGELFGPDQPIDLRLVDIPEALPALQGVIMELQDCACPALRKLTATADLNDGFGGVQWALLIGSVSR
jgi:malate dehydrogenase